VGGTCKLVAGELWDETEERLKLSVGELFTTQRQVKVLQEKLQEKIGEVSGVREQLEHVASAKTTIECDLSVERERFEQERCQYDDEMDKMRQRCAHFENENVELNLAERDRFRQLEAEFDTLRAEMDDVIIRYEAEKRRMKERIACLQNNNDELHTELKSLVETNALGQMLSNMAGAGSTGSIVSMQEDLLEFEMLERRLDALTASSAAADNTSIKSAQPDDDHLKVAGGDEQQKTASAARKRSRKNAPAIKFLLDRLQIEREKYCTATDSLERQVRELNGTIEMMRASSQTAYARRVVRSQSQPDVVGGQRVGMGANYGGGLSADAADVATAIATVRAKNLCLIRENQRLLADFAQLREHVGSVLVKQEVLQTVVERKQTGVQPQKSDGAASDNINRNDDDAGSNYEQAFDSLDQVINAQNTTKQDTITKRIRKMSANSSNDLVQDLSEVRLDLQGILDQIDTATRGQPQGAGDRQRENRLMMLLERELTDEKQEMDVLSKWYEGDKRRMQQELADLRLERTELRAQVDSLAFDFHDVSRELELYKREEQQRLGQRGGAASLIQYRSWDDLSATKTSTHQWKLKYGALYRDFLCIQRDFEVVDRQRREYQLENDMIQGEVLILRAERELDAERAAAGKTPLVGAAHLSEQPAADVRRLYDAHLQTLKTDLDTSKNIEKTLRHENTQLQTRNRLLDQQVSAARLDVQRISERLASTEAELVKFKDAQPARPVYADWAAQTEPVWVTNVRAQVIDWAAQTDGVQIDVKQTNTDYDPHDHKYENEQHGTPAITSSSTETQTDDVFVSSLSIGAAMSSGQPVAMTSSIIKSKGVTIQPSSARRNSVDSATHIESSHKSFEVSADSFSDDGDATSLLLDDDDDDRVHQVAVELNTVDQPGSAQNKPIVPCIIIESAHSSSTQFSRHGSSAERALLSLADDIDAMFEPEDNEQLDRIVREMESDCTELKRELDAQAQPRTPLPNHIQRSLIEFERRERELRDEYDRDTKQRLTAQAEEFAAELQRRLYECEQSARANIVNVDDTSTKAIFAAKVSTSVKGEGQA
jgi:hypothetical protein